MNPSLETVQADGHRPSFYDAVQRPCTLSTNYLQHLSKTVGSESSSEGLGVAEQQFYEIEQMCSLCYLLIPIPVHPFLVAHVSQLNSNIISYVFPLRDPTIELHNLNYYLYKNIRNAQPES